MTEEGLGLTQTKEMQEKCLSSVVSLQRAQPLCLDLESCLLPSFAITSHFCTDAIHKAENVCVCVCLWCPGGEFSLLQNLTEALSDDNARYIIRFANSLYLQQGVTFNPEFLHLMRKYFRAEVETVDFSESVAVAEQINSWVENHTESE